MNVASLEGRYTHYADGNIKVSKNAPEAERSAQGGNDNE